MFCASRRATSELLPSDGHVVDGGEDWGYPIVPARRDRERWQELWLDIAPLNTVA